MENIPVIKRKKNKHTKSQPTIYEEIVAAETHALDKKEEGILNISNISRIEETKEFNNNPNVNESREHYEQALGQLSIGHKKSNKRGATIDSLNGRLNLANSKSSLLNKKMIDSVKNLKQLKYDNSSSCLNLPTMTSRSFNPNKSTFRKKKDKPNTENKTQRMQIYKFREKKQIQASMNVYSLPEVKYDPDTLHEMRIQNMIVYNEVTCLLDKIKQLKEEQVGNVIFQLKNVTLEAQRNFNFRLEKLCGMVVQVSKIILQEFSKDPTSIGIEDMSYLLEHKAAITNEIKACEDNFNVLNKVIKFLTDSREAYSIISNRNDRTSAKPGEVLKFLGITSRARFYCSEIIERIRLMERNSRIKKAVQKPAQTDNKFGMQKPLHPNSDIKEVDESNINASGFSSINNSNIILPKISQLDKSPDNHKSLAHEESKSNGEKKKVK